MYSGRLVFAQVHGPPAAEDISQMRPALLTAIRSTFRPLPGCVATSSYAWHVDRLTFREGPASDYPQPCLRASSRQATMTWASVTRRHATRLTNANQRRDLGASTPSSRRAHDSHHPPPVCRRGLGAGALLHRLRDQRSHHRPVSSRCLPCTSFRSTKSAVKTADAPGPAWQHSDGVMSRLRRRRCSM